MTPPNATPAPVAPKTAVWRRLHRDLTFTETRRFVAELAANQGVRMSNRRCKAIATQCLLEWGCQDDGESEASSIGYHDPTGDTAVARVLYLITHY